MQDLRTYTLDALLRDVAAKSPAPGGGAVASAVGALSAALARMVVSYSLGRKSLEQHADRLAQAATALDRAAALLVELAREDAEAYERLNTLMKLPETDDRRKAEWAEAVAMSLAAPRATAAACADLLRLMENLAPITNRNLRSDLAIAAVLAEATARASWWNVAINLPLITDPAERESLDRQTREMLDEAAHRRDRITAVCTP